LVAGSDKYLSFLQGRGSNSQKSKQPTGKSVIMQWTLLMTRHPPQLVAINFIIAAFCCIFGNKINYVSFKPNYVNFLAWGNFEKDTQQVMCWIIFEFMRNISKWSPFTKLCKGSNKIMSPHHIQDYLNTYIIFTRIRLLMSFSHHDEHQVFRPKTSKAVFWTSKFFSLYLKYVKINSRIWFGPVS
jgi:hypothetical protein